MVENNDLLGFLTAIGLIITGIGVIVSINSMTEQNKLARTGWQINLLLRFEDRFDGKQMAQERLAAAKFLIHNQNLDINDPQWNAIDDLIDFFQSIGTFVQEGLLDIKFVSNFFGYWLLRYFKASEKYLTHVTTKIPGTWQQALNLYDQVKDFNSKLGREKIDNIKPEELFEFFQEEINRNEILQKESS